MAKLYPNPNYLIERDITDEAFGIRMRQLEVFIQPPYQSIVRSFTISDIVVLDNLEFQMTITSRDFPKTIFLRRAETTTVFTWASPGNLWYLNRLHEYELGPAPFVEFNGAGWGLTADYKAVVFRDNIGNGLNNIAIQDILSQGVVNAIWANNELVWHKFRPYKRPYVSSTPSSSIALPNPRNTRARWISEGARIDWSTIPNAKPRDNSSFESKTINPKPSQTPKPKLRAISLDDE